MGNRNIVLAALLSLGLEFAVLTPSAHGKGILEILRDKGVLTAEEYQQAIEEAQGKQKEVVQEAKTEAKQEALAEAKKQTKLPDWLSRVSLFGDVRYRHEGFYHSAIQTNNPTRNRERIRARVGVGVNVSEELYGKLRLVTGDSNDPISTNQTLSELFTRKPISLDWAYITAAPWKTFGLDKVFGSDKPMFALTAGKFPLPMFLPGGGSELVFDGDLSPEGVTEALTLWDRSSGLLRNVKVTGMQWSIKEINNKSATQLFDPTDAWMFGGQLAVQFAPTDASRLTFTIADYGFQRLDVLARERNSNSALVITNNVRRFNGAISGGMPVSPTSCASPFTAAGCIQGFLGGFNIFNAGAQLDLPTPWKEWPLTFFFDYARNTDAATDDKNGYWLGFKIGQVANRGDLRFTYTWAHTETDAVLSIFSYSDFGKSGGTNVEGNIFSLEYVLLPHLTLIGKEHLVNFINRPVGFHNPTQSRVQLDAVLSF
jgi:hypothetical protein